MNQEEPLEANTSKHANDNVLAPLPSNAAQSRAAETTAHPPDLQLIINSWASLPDAIRAGILAIITTATKQPPLSGEQTNA